MHEGDHDLLEGIETKKDHHHHDHKEKGPAIDLKKTVGIVALVLVVIVALRLLLGN